MKLPRRMDLVLWGVALVGTLSAVFGWRGSAAGTAPAPVLGRASAVGRVSPETLSVAVDRVIEADPFRLDRRPAAIAYRTELDGAVRSESRPPRPSLVLQGIVGGGRGRWGGLLSGIPGRDGPIVVHAGDTVSGLIVRGVGRDTVVVSASDTTWRLTVRRAWQ